LAIIETGNPKQFLALTDTRTMFQLTVLRVMDRRRFAAPLIVANAAHANIVRDQLAEIGVTEATLLLEPCARNTAPAIAQWQRSSWTHQIALCW
jgi:mannose-1-phosphate guanylyltransferase/mannose-1-phosphate guanylyltransferase/mannose-6-phosphate isomerase